MDSSLVIWWTLLVGFLGVLALVIRDMTYWRSKGIPYAKSIPFISGFLNRIVNKKSLPQATIDCYQAFPGAKYYGFMESGTPKLVVKDPEIVKEIGVKSSGYFPNHRSFVSDKFDPLLAKNVFNLKDDRWREMRTVLTPAFTANKLKYMFQLVSQCASDFVQYLNEHSELTKDVDLRDLYTRYTNDVVATAAFGVSVNSLKNRDNEFYQNGRKLTTMFESIFNILKITLAAIFPTFMRLLGFTFFPKTTNEFLRKLVKDTIQIREAKGIVRPDMIHLLMQARHIDSGTKLTTDEITAQALGFLFAGFDTSPRLMCFVSHILSYEPEIQARLREEIDAIFDEEQGNITYESITRMKYMDMVLSETLRLYPLQLFTDRVCLRPYELPPSTDNAKPFTVPPGMTVLIPIFGFHRDPNYFSEPLKFDPERFSEENKNDIKPYTYIPFGFGPRKCIGDRFVLMETKILIIRLMQRFTFEPSERTTKHIEFRKDGSMGNPEKGFWMKLVPREVQSINDESRKSS